MGMDNEHGSNGMKFGDEEQRVVRDTGRLSSFPFASLALSESNFEAEGELSEPGKQDRIQHKEAEREVTQTVRNEIIGVQVWKCLFVFWILVTAAIVSTATYIYVKQESDERYNVSYNLLVSGMRANVRVHVQSVTLAFQHLADHISADAAAKNATFPFYTMDDFEATGEGVRAQSKVEMVGWFPFVEPDQLLQWMQYSWNNQVWLDTSRAWSLRSGEFSIVNRDYLDSNISRVIYDLGGPNGTPQLSQSKPPYATAWQTSPPVFNPLTINLDFKFFEFARTAIQGVIEKRHAFFTRILIAGETGSLIDLIFKKDDHEKYHTGFVDWNHSDHDSRKQPHGSFFQPVFEDAQDPNSKLVGVIAAAVAWDAYLTYMLPEGASGLHCVVENTCGQSLTYKMYGSRAYFMGRGDLHEKKYDYSKRVIPFYNNNTENRSSWPKDPLQNTTGQCIYFFNVYASQEFENASTTSLALILTCVFAGAFFFVIVSYLIYDWFVKRRNDKIVRLAAQFNEIVASLYPKQVIDRLIRNTDVAVNREPAKDSAFANTTARTEAANTAEYQVVNQRRREKYLLDIMFDSDPTEVFNLLDAEGFMYESKPIADLYPEATIMFADIAGFTAWSSTREPAQVFTLLETIYRSFDSCARRRCVFKVETIGDCYVAVGGLPDPMPDHAVVMCRFAKECIGKMREMVKRLEAVLGPDTMSLELRVGLHSGPVTAGVLRGEKSRFQLFGDTMNTASRMESTGTPGLVHISQETADILIAAGKSHWVKPRADKVHAKGKGFLQTYWVSTSSKGYSDSGHSSSRGGGMDCDERKEGHPDFSDEHSFVDVDPGEQEQTNSLVNWNTEVFASLLCQIAARGRLSEDPQINREWENGAEYRPSIDEFEDVIDFPVPKSPANKVDENKAKSSVSSEALEQLHHFIKSVAALYPDHPYHGFSHASHATLSVTKLLSETKSDFSEGSDKELGVNPSRVFAGEPMIQFACLLAVLVQDVNHPGVPRFVVAQEGGGRFDGQLKAIDTAWTLFMNKNYVDLRAAIYRTPEERKLFRQVFVQCVLATEMFDKRFAENREVRWEKAFGPSTLFGPAKSRLDARATLTMECIIQASNIIHAMEHFDIYRRWNDLLFEEVYRAYQQGRMNKDPSENWHAAELKYFDNIVFPMTKKLAETKAFKDGVVRAYDDYARHNRSEWENRGQALVVEMLQRCRMERD